ncbi:DUF4190 domain-containing protein [Streptomyces sp. NBC_01136]|uniref:DUF4190 domain-containing protein n=1 Tax=unclassified Streptomyces TaxID=2593676 RepID=UPI0032552775|nr:DUF4190 domain-containing protein [Streptomyces sp. NBC_01136]
MSDEAQVPQAPQNAAATPWASPDQSAPPPTQIDVPSAAGPEDAIPAGNPAPGSPPRGPLDKAPAERQPEPNPWAPPADQPPSRMTGAPATPTFPIPPAPPTPFSAHDQPTVLPVPGPGTPGHPDPRHRPWENPFASQAAASTPHPQPAPGEPVPPPPIAPEGPGQVPYGYGYGYGHGHGYPAPGAGYPGYPAPGTGYPGAPGYGWPGMPLAPSNGMGTAGLVLGIVSAVVFCLWPLAIILGILGVTFGVMGRRKARRGEATNPGQALTGIICGAVGIVLGIAMILFYFALPADNGSNDPVGDDGYSTSLVLEHLG